MRRSFNYIDKGGKLIPWINAQMAKYSEFEDISPEMRGRKKMLEEIKVLSLDGMFDWQQDSE